jgi:hypothetical protein
MIGSHRSRFRETPFKSSVSIYRQAFSPIALRPNLVETRAHVAIGQSAAVIGGERRDELAGSDPVRICHVQAHTTVPNILPRTAVSAIASAPQNVTLSAPRTTLAPIERLPRPVSLAEMRLKLELEGMPLLQKGSRLSVQKIGRSRVERSPRSGQAGLGRVDVRN